MNKTTIEVISIDLMLYDGQADTISLTLNPPSEIHPNSQDDKVDVKIIVSEGTGKKYVDENFPNITPKIKRLELEYQPNKHKTRIKFKSPFYKSKGILINIEKHDDTFDYKITYWDTKRLKVRCKLSNKDEFTLYNN